jgi:cation diffusion facilitator family transporter
MSTSDTRLDSKLRYAEGRRIVVAGVITNICLTFIKVTGGLLGGSQALVADGVHSLSDLVTDVVVFFGLRYSSKPRDANHPYGHGKIETLATTLVGILLIMTGGLLGWNALRASIGSSVGVPGRVALVVVIVSIVFKEVLYRYTMVYARRIHSSALVANAWHHRSDALSSVAALGGILGARLGFPVLDPVGAMIVALMIIKVGVDVVWRASGELVEETLQDGTTAAMSARACEVDGVLGVPEIHLRYVGPSIVVDMAITVSGRLSVAEGHRIAHSVEDALTTAFDEIAVVSVHVEPDSGLPASHRDDPARVGAPDAATANGEADAAAGEDAAGDHVGSPPGT